VNHYPFMKDMGADPVTRQTIPFDAADKEYMDTLFADVITPLEKEGVDFWWLDWQQYEDARSIPSLTNLFWLNTLLYQHTAQNGQRGASFSRWAGWGDHRHPIHFSGDSNTGFPMLAFEVPFTATAGNVGCFFWSHDIGGHMGGRNEESYTRWVQFGAVSPALRSHSTRDAQTDRRPWNYPQWAEDSMRVAFHLRSELFPYIYTSAAQSTQQTIPLDRPLYLDTPKVENAYHNAQEFLLGDNILVAPIVTAGDGPGRVAAQTVWFPPGQWFNSFTGERFMGGQDVLVTADINEFPLYARGGVPIPMQPYTPRMATAPLRTLRVRCWPGADGVTGRSTLYEDDGVTTAYTKGQIAIATLSYTRRGEIVTVTVGATAGHYAGQPERRSLVIELPDMLKAARATLNGKPVAVAYDAATFTNRITVPARPIAQAATIVVQAAPGGWVTRHLKAIVRRAAGVRRPIAPGDFLSSAAQQAALLAVGGVGLVAKNEGAYLYHGAVHYLFYAPQGLLDKGRVQVIGGAAMTLPASGEPLEIPGTPYTWRGRRGMNPAQISFTIHGKEYHLSETLSENSDLTSADNLTQYAKISVSGLERGTTWTGAVDGLIGGYPDDRAQEWPSGQKEGAWLRLDWDSSQKVNRIVLWDRPNQTDQVTGGTLTFSDGSTLAVGRLPDDAKTGLTLTFPAKTITWVKFTITAVKPGTQNSGLAEIAVFRVK